jgi:hypothetical protein
MSRAIQTPLEDLMKADLELYEQGASKIHHYSSSIPIAIKEYWGKRIKALEEPSMTTPQETIKHFTNLKTETMNTENYKKMPEQIDEGPEQTLTISGAIKRLEEVVGAQKRIKDAVEGLSMRWFNEQQEIISNEQEYENKMLQETFIKNLYGIADKIESNNHSIEMNFERIANSL